MSGSTSTNSTENSQFGQQLTTAIIDDLPASVHYKAATGGYNW